MSSDRVFVGLETSFSHDLPATLDKVYEDKMSGVIAPLFHPRFKRDDNGVSDTRDGPQTRSDLVMDSRGWTASVVGLVSKWLDLDALSPQTRLAAEKVFKQEVAWASHLSVPAVLLPTPRHGPQTSNYARVVNQSVTQAQYLQFWVRIPLSYCVGTVASTLRHGGPGIQHCNVDDDDLETAAADPWTAWHALRATCEYHPKLGVALELTADLPSSEHLQRWLGEPVRALVIPTSLFLTNRKGFPTLSTRHQHFVSELFRVFASLQIYLTGRPRHRDATSLLPYVQYIHFLSSKRAAMDAKALFEAPYLDYLQAPLQPLMDNLESQTYETFEQDGFKYQQYEKAITKALDQTPRDKVSVVMVVGAGRGPLVRCALRAAVTSNRTLRLFAVEKNPNAVITLRNLKVTERWDNVTIVASDMRFWDTTEKADIMVSELLGSFSDNELSPECLDGAQAFLSANGISIPCAYTSYVAPIMSSKLWNDVHAHASLKSFETPYVVRLHNMYTIAPSQACFTFTHPNWATRIDNRRFVDLTFEPQAAAVVHGFAGYFDAVLYDDVTLSINPSTHSDGMFSWFPIFFPLRTPLAVGCEDVVHVQFWRLSANHRVWYEWAMQTEKHQTPIHNPNGRSYWIGL